MRRGILADRDELRALASRARGRVYGSIHDTLRKRCSLILEAAPVSEQLWRIQWQQGRLGSAVQAARTTQGRILDLLVAHRIEPNTAYRDRAVEELDNLVRWARWVDPAHDALPADLCTAEAAVAVAVGLDWLWEELDASKRDAYLRALREKAVAPYLQGVREGAWWYECYHHWNAVVNGGCGLAALALGDEDEQAQQGYRRARAGLDRFFGALGREGGWDEGLGNWAYGIRYVLLLAEAAKRLVDDQQIYHHRGMDRTGLFPVYFTPNGQPAGFASPPIVPLYGTFYLLAREYGLKETAWWLDTYAFHRDVTTSGWSAAGLALVFRPPRLRTPRTVKLEPVKVFREIGWAAMADRWPRPGMYVSLKTGELSAHHTWRAMNCVQVQLDGELLLSNTTERVHSEPFTGRRGEQPSAARHNTLVVAERDHQIDARGSVRRSSAGRTHRWVCCDAGDACGENARFFRHAVMVLDRPGGAVRALLVLDELTNAVPERVEVLWHSPREVQLVKNSSRGTMRGRNGRAYFAFGATVKMNCALQELEANERAPVHTLRISAGVVDRALFASVFSRKRLSEPPQILLDGDGNVRIGVDNKVVCMKRGPEHLEFEAVRSS